MRVSLIVALSFVGVFSLLVLVPVIQESYQQTNPCSDDEVPMRAPGSDKIECIDSTFEGTYRSDGYSRVKIPLVQEKVQEKAPEKVGACPNDRIEMLGPRSDEIQCVLPTEVGKYRSQGFTTTEFIPQCTANKVPMQNPVDGYVYCVPEDEVKLYLNDEFINLNTMKTKEKVPAWIKNIADWYGNDLLSEGEFVNAIDHLIAKGVIDRDKLTRHASNMEKFKHDFPMTDSRFPDCVLLHDSYKRLGEDDFRNRYETKSFLTECIELYNDPVLRSTQNITLKLIYDRWEEITHKEKGENRFLECMNLHDSYLEEGVEFTSKHPDVPYVNDCVSLYEDPIWDITGDKRIPQLYSKFKEISLSQSGSFADHTVELMYFDTLGDEKYFVHFNVCAGDYPIEHATVLVKSRLESVKVATYKQILATTCRDYETVLHAMSSENIDAHLIEIRDTSPIQPPDTGDEYEVSCPIGWIEKTSELGHTRCVGAPLN